ncbi:MAG TPA: acyl carrier protein [Micromonosporaceae bacterium]|nr:acyl carrier protein [Micromonosporaceae bacterium]
MNRTDAESLLRQALHQVAPDVDLDALQPDDDLRETLGLDSLDFLQIVELLSERSGMRIDEDDYGQLAVVAGALDFLSTPRV